MAGRIAVVGTGTMGSGIAQAALSSGYDVVCVAHSEKSAQAALSSIKNSFVKAVAKGALTKEQAEDGMKRLSVTTEISHVNGCWLVIEAIAERPEEKKQILSEIEKNADKSAIIATNTSSISINTLSSSLTDPSRFLGIHFFNPVPVMKLVEIVLGINTSRDASRKATEFTSSLGKTNVKVNDYPGFVANRLLMIFINEAVIALEKGIAAKEGIDEIAKLGFNHPMGPLQLADFIGLDVCRDIMEQIYEQTNEERFKPSDMLSRMVSQGLLGRKSGKGFYDYATK